VDAVVVGQENVHGGLYEVGGDSGRRHRALGTGHQVRWSLST
jgi:hypothetical protein